MYSLYCSPKHVLIRGRSFIILRYAINIMQAELKLSKTLNHRRGHLEPIYLLYACVGLNWLSQTHDTQLVVCDELRSLSHNCATVI